MTPNTYRNPRRMALAMDMLSNTTLCVKAISARLGFEHTPAFSSMFRKLSGSTPSEIVRRYRPHTN
ncbi:MAG: helix-turn-helix domain-containing protein [Kiritimatiellae bacterium]|nr:helix-turn-helix domain-containing protein [Kiritimatiellia bacterium]